MNNSIRLLVEGFFDDEIFNTDNDIKTDIEDLGKYYDYQVGDFYYKGRSKNPYAICCGESKQFKDNKPRFCLLKHSKRLLTWRTWNILVKELECFKFDYYYLNSFNDFRHIDEDGYKNTQVIKNNYNIKEFPIFEYCLNQGDNVYLPAIDELQILYLNKNKLGKYSFINIDYWSSTQYSSSNAYYLIFNSNYSYISNDYKIISNHVRPFFHID